MWAIYVPRGTLNLAVYVGDKPVGSSNYSASPDEINSNYPQYFELQSALLHQGFNTVYVRISPSQAGENYLSEIMIGSANDLFTTYYWRLLVQVIGPLIVTALNAFMCVFMLALWARQRNEAAFGWFGLACLLWVIRNAHFFVRNPPLAYSYWYAVSHASLAWVILASFLFSFRLVGQRYPYSEKVLFLYALFSTIALLASAETSYFFLARDLNFLGLMILSPVLISYRLLLLAWRVRTSVTISIAIAAFVCYVLGAYDFFVLMQEPASDISTMNLMPYGSLLFTLTASSAVIDRIVQSQRAVERFNVELETRVAERESELSLSYAYTSEFEKSAAIAAERQRIVRDIHDDLGTQLMSSIPLAEHGQLSSEEVATLLRDCIDALRLAIDSLKPLGDDLNAVLGNFRSRFESRLAAAGLQLEWRVAELPRDPQITPEVVLQLMRIVQEAITNVIKHANARVVHITAGYNSLTSTIVLQIADNGIGFDPSITRTGEGLSSMAIRAKRIGAEFEMTASSSGTGIQVKLPLEREGQRWDLVASRAFV